jgi:molybdate transport system substrate-binding protein
MTQQRTSNTIAFAFILILLCGCFRNEEHSTKHNESLVLYAAASLTNVMQELADSFNVQSNVNIKINSASSGTLARQIMQGAEPHIYISG